MTAEEAFASLCTEVRQLGDRMQADAPSGTEPTVGAWCERLRQQADYAARGFSILSRFTEYRRAYGRRVDEATVNRVQMRLEGAMARLPELMALTAEGIASIHAEQVALLQRRIAEQAERLAHPLREVYASAHEVDRWPGEGYEGTSLRDLLDMADSLTARASLTPTEDASHPDDGEPEDGERQTSGYARGHLVGCHYDCRIPDCGCAGDCTHFCFAGDQR